MNLSATSITVSSAIVLWNMPLDSNTDDSISFRVHLCGANTNETLHIPGSQTYASLQELQQFTKYTVRVQAVSDVSEGHLSIPMVFTTLNPEGMFNNTCDHACNIYNNSYLVLRAFLLKAREPWGRRPRTVEPRKRK